MIAVIKGDIIASRKLINQDTWMKPLQSLFSQWGNNPEHWELVWGDFFQLEINDPKSALQKALTIKALIKKITPTDTSKSQAP